MLFGFDFFPNKDVGSSEWLAGKYLTVLCVISEYGTEYAHWDALDLDKFYARHAAVFDELNEMSEQDAVNESLQRLDNIPGFIKKSRDSRWR